MRVVMIDTAAQTPFYDFPLCEALVDAGCDVVLLTAPFLYADLPASPVSTRHLFGRVATWPWLRTRQRWRQVARGLEYPIDWGNALRLIRHFQPDVVHVQWGMVPAIDALAFRALHRMGIRVIFTVHDIRPHYGALRRALLSTRPLLRLADDLVVHTLANKWELCEIAQVPPERVHHIQQGHVMNWSGPPLSRAEARKRLELPDAPIILFFGVVKPYKRLEMLLDALVLIRQRLPTALLLIAGRPEGSFAAYEHAIDRLGLGSAHAVLRRLGYIPETDVPTYFAAADVVALPYTDADFSGVLLHAASFARPVVATATGGFHQVIEHGETGFLVGPQDTRALADALGRILSDPLLGERLGRQSRERARMRHDWQASARKTVRLYRRELTDA